MVQESRLENDLLELEYMPIDEAIKILGDCDSNNNNNYALKQNFLHIDKFEARVLDHYIFFLRYNKKTKYIVKEKSVTEFLENYISREEAFKQSGSSKKESMDKHLEKMSVERVKIGDTLIFYNKVQFNDLFKLELEYMPMYDAIKILGNSESTNLFSINRKILRLDNFETRVLDNPIFFSRYYRKTKYIVKEKCVTEFLENYISQAEAFKQSDFSKMAHMDKYLQRMGVERFRIAASDAFIFYNKAQFNANMGENRTSTKELKVSSFAKTLEIDGYDYVTSFLKKYNFSKRQWRQIISFNNLEQYEIVKPHATYFPTQLIEDLFKKLTEELNEIRKDYYTFTEIFEIFKVKHAGQLPFIKNFRIPIPAYLRALMDRADKHYFYKKDGVAKYIEKKDIEEKLYNVDLETPYETYRYQFDVLGIAFPVHLKRTEEIWDSFTRDRLDKVEQNDRVLSSTISTYVKCAQHLLNCNKEIYNYNAKELNLIFFNMVLPKSHQFCLFLFISAVYTDFKDKYGKEIYQMKAIYNPWEREIEPREKTIYTLADYNSFFKYASDIQLHKLNALFDIQNLVLGREYKRYDSAWLYVLVHLNNGWRHNDVIEFPRISLKGTQIKDLKWFETNEVSPDDAKRIIREVQFKVLQHHKTGAERYFFCSPELQITFVTAAAIAELRTRIDNPSCEYIIDYKTKQQLFTEDNTPYKAFFENFNGKVEFESLKMNRTLLSLLYSIVNRGGATDVDAYELAKHMRGHKDSETTNIYVLIPQEHMDFIASQLFDRDYFGYIPNILNDLLYGPPEDQTERTKQIKALKASFGSVYKMEGFAGYLNEVLKDRGEVETILRGCSKAEIKEKHFKLITHQLPAKEEDFQCLVSESSCLYPETRCRSCHLAIAHFYALSSLTQRLKEQFLFFRNTFPNLKLESDKIRYSKLFYNDLLLFTEAVNKFGKETVFWFMDITPEDYNNLLSATPSFGLYLKAEEVIDC